MNDSGGSLVEFFYNVIPGTIFLVLLSHYNIFNLISIFPENASKDSVVLIFAYLVGGLFFGFVFQGLTKLLRDLCWNAQIMEKIKNENVGFNSTVKKLKVSNLKNAFYLMDNKLRWQIPAFLPTHFSSRFAFWSNNLFGFFFVIIARIVSGKLLDYDYIILGIFLWFSWKMSNLHLKGFYDSVFKSYRMSN